MQNKFYTGHQEVDIRFAVMILAVGILLFCTGLHAIDTAWNMKYIQENNPALHLTDTTVAGNNYDSADVYRNGLLLTYAGFLITVMGVLLVSSSSQKFS